ncbi:MULTISPECIES: AAA family ATPase [Acetobacter]|nr:MULTISPECIES: AAA family ATPase [Acetobacter]MCP1270927.1 AAA family ATPase [Acetobacter cerevisiae]MCP1278842.1 AAA family ATPase [Acetobacter cerevisiae]
MTAIMNDHARLRDAVRDRKDLDKLSLTQIASACGASSPAISSFLSGNYAGDNEKLAGKLQAWLDAQQAKERLRTMRPIVPDFVMTETARTLMNIMESAQFDVDLAVIAGNAGTGKTMAAEAYQRQTNNVFMLTADPSMASQQALLHELADLLGCNDKGVRRIRAIVRRLRGTDALLIIDEAQHLSVKAVEEVRSIHDQAKVGVVFIGNAPLNAKFDGLGRTAEFAQLFSRIGLRKKINKPRIKDMCALLEAWGIQPGDVEMAAKEIGRREGGLRSMTKVLRNATKISRVHKHEAIEVEDLKAAWGEHMTGEFPPIRVKAGAQ